MITLSIYRGREGGDIVRRLGGRAGGCWNGGTRLREEAARLVCFVKEVALQTTLSLVGLRTKCVAGGWGGGARAGGMLDGDWVCVCALCRW